MGREIEVLTLAFSGPPKPEMWPDKKIPARGRVCALGVGTDCCGQEGLDWRRREENINWSKAV